jgi:hypothetical protein
VTRGDAAKARRYADRAADLAPDNPLVQTWALPTEAPPPAPEKPQLASAGRDEIEPLQPGPEILAEQFAEIEVAPPVPIDPQVAPAPANVALAETAPAEIEAAPATSPAAPTPAGQDIDDLVFRPHAYAGRQVELTGSVVYLMWDYRLKSETGQNSLVVNIDGLQARLGRRTGRFPGSGPGPHHGHGPAPDPGDIRIGGKRVDAHRTRPGGGGSSRSEPHSR